jgi:integrating conjugative element membrane protein (TIGR03745 family)
MTKRTFGLPRAGRSPLTALIVALNLKGSEAFGALPTLVDPSTKPADANDWLAYMKGYIQDGGMALALLLSLAGLVWLGWHAFADLNAARKGDKEWGDVGLTNVIGAAVFLWVSYLLSKVTGIMT